MEFPVWLWRGFVALALSCVLTDTLWNVRRGWLLSRRGIRVPGTVVGSQRNRSNVTYRVRFRNLAGQEVENFSAGWHWSDPEYYEGDEVVLRYDEQDNDYFMLEGELRPVQLYGHLVLVVVIVGIGGWSLLHPAAARHH